MKLYDVERMKEGQENIYYIYSPDIDNAKNSPQLEAFRAKGVEVLFMIDAIDEFWIPMQNDYMNKPIKSVTRGASELSKIASKVEEEKKPEASEDEKNKEAKLINHMQLAVITSYSIHYTKLYEYMRTRKLVFR